MRVVQYIQYLTLLILLASCSGTRLVPEYDANAPLEVQLKEIYTNGQLPGFAVALVNANGIQFKEALGFASLASRTSFTENTSLNIASVSKTFIGIALMQAIEDELLTLETSINDVLPFTVVNPNYPNDSITFGQLALHTSSIDDYEIEYKSVFVAENQQLYLDQMASETGQYFESWKANVPQPLGSFLRNALSDEGSLNNPKRFLSERPGTVFKYSNLGAALLAYAIELVTEKRFSDYVTENILQPNNLNQTGWSSDEEKSAIQYFQDQQVVPIYVNNLYPAGGMHSSLGDLCKYLTLILQSNKGDEIFMTQESFQEMTRARSLTVHNHKNESTTRGLMWAITDENIGHNGGNYGTIVLLSFDRELNYGRIFMTNISSYTNGDLMPQIREIWKLLENEIHLLN